MDTRMTRVATCLCGGLSATCDGEPARISICHCLACQRRTGAPFSAQSRFPRGQVTVSGQARQFIRLADSGATATFHFCPTCGSTVFWELSGFPDLIAVALGMFADPSYPPPTVSVWERSAHPWIASLSDIAIEHVY